MTQYMELNGLIHAQYPSKTALAQKLGWSRQKLYMILSGNREPSIRDVQDLAEALKVPFALMIKFFLK